MSLNVMEEIAKVLGANQSVDISLNDAKFGPLIENLHRAKSRLELARNGIAVDFPSHGQSITVYRVSNVPPAQTSKAKQPAAVQSDEAKPQRSPAVKKAQHSYVPPLCAKDLISVLSDEASHNAWLTGPTQSGKAQPYDAMIQTPTGPVKMGDLVVGAMVFGGNGRPCKVKGIFEQGMRPVYRVEFDNGEVSTECDMDHNWKYLTRNRSFFNRSEKRNKPRLNSNYNNWQVMSLRDIVKKQGMGIDDSKRGYVPICGSVEFSGSVPNLLSPYALGVLLGDGSLSEKSSISISSADDAILSRVSKELPSNFILSRASKYDYRIKQKIFKGHSPTVRAYGEIKTELQRLGLLGTDCFTKFIPDEYKYVDSRSRLELLRGLMDTDGSIGIVSRMEYCTVSERLASDVSWLIRSLGGKCKTSTRHTHYTYKGEKRTGALSYRLAVKMTENPFWLPRKANKFYAISRREDRRLSQIVPAGEKQCRCIMVDSPDQTYLTDDFIVTHNTTLVKYIGKQLNRKVFQINCRGDMGSEVFFGEKTVAVDPETKSNIIIYQKGVVEQAMVEGLDAQGNEVGEPAILFIDEAASMPAHVAIGINRLLESDDARRTMVIAEDGGRVVRSHSKFRILLAANTVGRGANSAEDAMYSAQMDALDISLLNRVAVVFRMGYDREIEKHILLEKVGDDKVVSQILRFRDAIRGFIKQGKLSSPFSTKRIVDIANMYRVFGDIGKAIYYTAFEQLLPEEKAVYNEQAVILLGKDLMKDFVQAGVDY